MRPDSIRASGAIRVYAINSHRFADNTYPLAASRESYQKVHVLGYCKLWRIAAQVQERLSAQAEGWRVTDMLLNKISDRPPLQYCPSVLRDVLQQILADRRTFQ